LRLVFGKERSWLMSAELDKKASEESFFKNLLARRSVERASTGIYSAKLAQNQLIETSLIDTRKGNSFTLNFDVFSNEGTSNERISSNIQLGDISLNTPFLTNSYNLDNEGTGRLKPQLNLLALVKLFKRQSTNLRTSSLGYSIQLKIEFYDKNKVLKSSNIQTINLNAGTWASGLYELPAIQDHTIFYVKFSIINPNTFVVYLDNWKIEEKGKVILQENHYYPYGKEISSLGRKGTPNHEFTFSGKEDNEEFGWDRYDFGARTLGEDFPVWNAVDRFAEKYHSISPYSYTAGNPIKYIDINGDSTRYYDNGGNLLYTSHDDLENAYVVVSDKAMKFFKKLIGTFGNEKEGNSRGVNMLMRKFGDNYMTSDYEQFFDEHQGDKTSENTGKENPNGLSSEYQANLKRNEKGELRIAGWSVQRGDYNSANITGSNVIADSHLHTHPNVGKPVPNEKNYYGGVNPSYPGDEGFVNQRHDYGHSNYSVIVTNTNLILYKRLSSSEQEKYGKSYNGGNISVPRNELFKK
jgi:RHS repeat-associated protein